MSTVWGGYVGALRADGLRPEELGPGVDPWLNEPRLQVRRSG
ncbi:MAG: hypothetical protein ACK4F7_09540 [Inhella sp.]